MNLFDPRSWRPYFAGSVAAHLVLAATALLFRSDLDAHAPKVMYADLLSAEPRVAAPPAGAPKTMARVAHAANPPSLPLPAAAPSSPAAPETPAEPMPAADGGGGKAGAASESTAKASGSELNLYVSRVIDALNRARTYPRDALAREEEGVVVLEVSVAEDGSLSEEKVEVPSAYPSLNRAALETVKRVGRFPPPPRPPLILHVPIRFKIQSR